MGKNRMNVGKAVNGWNIPFPSHSRCLIQSNFLISSSFKMANKNKAGVELIIFIFYEDEEGDGCGGFL